MSTTIRPFNIDFAIKTVESITIRKLAGYAEEAYRHEILICLLEDLTAVTPQMMTSVDQIYNTLWLRIREVYTENTLAFILSATSEMMMRFLSHGWTNEIVSDFFVQTVPLNKGTPSVFDETLTEQLIDASNAKLIFSENSWYIYIVLLTMTNIRATVIEQLDEKPKGKTK
jgi:hypothetical protein